MKNKILTWIQGPRNFYEGAAIYNTYGYNQILKKRFANKNETNEALLFTELCKLAEITEDQANKYPRQAKANIVIPQQPKVEYLDDTLFALMSKLGIKTSDFESDDLPEKISQADTITQEAYAGARQVFVAIPETTKRVIKIREEYPFLKAADCPTEIKLLVHDMFNEHDKYREAQRQLVEEPENSSIERFFKLAQTAVESYLSNREMWEELDYYKERNVVLGHHPILQKYNQEKELKALSDIDLNQKLLNVRSNLTKSRNKIKEAAGNEKKLQSGNDGVKKWESILKLIETEMDARKK